MTPRSVPINRALDRGKGEGEGCLLSSLAWKGRKPGLTVQPPSSSFPPNQMLGPVQQAVDLTHQNMSQARILLQIVRSMVRNSLPASLAAYDERLLAMPMRQ